MQIEPKPTHWERRYAEWFDHEYVVENSGIVLPQKPTGRSQEGAVGILQTRTGDLSAKNRKLVSKHNDLELLELTRTQTQRRDRKDRP